MLGGTGNLRQVSYCHGHSGQQQRKMREVLGGGLAGLNDGWADRLGYDQSKPHDSWHISEGVSYVAAGKAGKGLVSGRKKLAELGLKFGSG